MTKLLLKLCCAVAAIVSLAFPASAYTIDDLSAPNCELFDDGAVAFEVLHTQKNATSTSYRTPFMGFPYTSSGQITVIDAGTEWDGTPSLMIDGLFGGTFYGVFRINGTTISCTSTGYRFDSNSVKPVTGETTENGSKYPYFCLWGGQWRYNSVYTIQDSWTGTVTEDDDYYIITMNPAGIQLFNNRAQSLGFQYYSKEVIYIPKSGKLNALFTDNYLNTDREYPARAIVDMDTKRFQIWNMTSNGFAIEHTLNQAYSNGWYQYYTAPDKKPVEGTLYPQSATKGTFALDAKQGVNSYPEFPDTDDDGRKYYDQYGNVMFFTIMYQYYLCQAGSTNTSSIVNGTYEIKEYNHDDLNRWHKNSGGALRTSAEIVMDFDDMQKRNDSRHNNAGDNVGPYKNTQLTAEVELTANPTFASHVVGYDNGLVRLAANIKEDKCDYAESYELVVLPYSASTIAGDAAFTHNGHGHSKAVNFTLSGTPSDDFFHLLGANARVANTKTQMGFQMTYDQLKAAGWNDTDMNNVQNGKLSFYIKTNYNNGMEPTYHALTTASNISTGIDLNQAVAEVAVTIAPVAGGIQVEGAETVAVYTTTGTEVYNGPAGVIEVAPGLYVVNASGKVMKVIVK